MYLQARRRLPGGSLGRTQRRLPTCTPGGGSTSPLWPQLGKVSLMCRRVSKVYVHKLPFLKAFCLFYKIEKLYGVIINIKGATNSRGAVGRKKGYLWCAVCCILACSISLHPVFTELLVLKRR